MQPVFVSGIAAFGTVHANQGISPVWRLGRLLAAVIWGVSAADAGTLMALAIYIPARNAVRIDPMVALRNE